MNSRPDEVERQRRYFADLAAEYDSRVEDEFEHAFALSLLVGVIQQFSFRSVLDIGSGTGRAVAYLRSRQPDLRIQGVEPVEALRRVGHAKGIPDDDLIEGDATALHFKDNDFDVVCEFGVLHHIPRPEQAVTEMLRVASSAIFISDSNNFGQGSGVARSVKQAANAIGVWPALNYLKTCGRRFTYSEGDGVAYSYSVFNNYAQIAKACTSVHIVNTSSDLCGRSPYRTAGHVALLGLLK